MANQESKPLPPPTPENQAILDAYSNFPSASLMIDAKAGVGKTTQLRMIGKLADESPRRPDTLALVFNKRNQEEMLPLLPSWWTVKTMNGLGHGALMKGMGLKLDLKDNKSSMILRDLLREWGIGKLEDGDWEDAMTLLNHARGAGVTPDIFKPRLIGLNEDSEAQWRFMFEDNDIEFHRDMYNLVHEVLVRHIAQGLKGTIDFDDQIFLSVLGAGSFSKFDIVLVDEAQDLSSMNHRMVQKSLSYNGRLIVVGDPRQAIYAFRGAHSKSMAQMRSLRPEWIDLPLSTTFRCPKAVVARQQEHVPGYTAAPTNKDGEVLDFRKKEEWTLADLPTRRVAVLSRLNSDLLAFAFRCIAHGVGVKMLGRDIGKQLVRRVRKISGSTNKDINTVLADIRKWRDEEVADALEKFNESKVERIQDVANCLFAVTEMPEVKDLESMCSLLESIFANEAALITLSTGHRAKGGEWPTVVFLNPGSIPSKFAQKQKDQGNPDPYEQEMNLKYVIETRTQETLVLANLKEFTP